MKREFRIISALEPTPVPVPEAIALWQDATGAEPAFYLMSDVPGSILKEQGEVESHFPPPLRRNIADSLIRVLAELHAIDPASVGLSDLSKHDGYIERQLRRWHGQYQQSSAEISSDVPAIDAAFVQLGQRIPPQRQVSIVHGDYRLDNTMISDDGRVAAVLDWEICTLGDPLADLGLLMVYWTDPDDPNSALGRATCAPGFPSRAELASAYAAHRQVDLSDLPYYVAFAYWKLACILQGVYSRYVQGASGGDPSDVSLYADQVVWLAEQALATLELLR
jgi:aminoglycoside phosphotransferase (APT) family kinase protein